MSEKQAFFFHMIPHEKVKRGVQALIVERDGDRKLAYEGQSEVADELFLTALIMSENGNGLLPVLLVNTTDFEEGWYKTKYGDEEPDATA